MVIKQLAIIVDNKNSQSNIKLTIINTKIPIEANSVLFDSERLYTIWQSYALFFTLSILSWRSIRLQRGEIPIIIFFYQSYNKIGDRCW